MEILNRPSRYALLLVMPLSLLLTGCFEDFDPQVETDPVLCLNSIITAGQPVEARVTQTWYYPYQYGGAFDRDITVRDAEVLLYADGELKETLVFDEDNRLAYHGTYLPQPGQSILIEARSKQFGDARGEVVIPPAPVTGVPEYTATSTGSYLYETEDPYNGSKVIVADINFTLDITMPVDGSDGSMLYCVDYRTLIPSDSPVMAEFTLWDLRYNAEPIFSEHISGLEAIFGGEPDEYLFFTSRSFAGRTYPLRLIFNRGRYWADLNTVGSDEGRHATVRVAIASVSPSYYDWMMFCWKLDNGISGSLGDIGYAEDMPGYSNVSTHAGVIAARTVAYMDIDLYDFIDGQIEKTAE